VVLAESRGEWKFLVTGAAYFLTPAIDKVAIQQNRRTGAWEKRGSLFAGFSGFILPTMPYLRNSKLLLMVAAGIVAASAPFPTGAQQQASDINGRDVLEQVLTQTYQLSIVGKGMMGVGSATAIRRAGTIVLVQKPGLYGSFDRNQIASSSIHGDTATLYHGNNDIEIPVGERFYVFNIAVGQDNVTLALLSAQLLNNKKGSGRVWAAVTFDFPVQSLVNANKDEVFRAIDPWVAPEGHYTGTAVVQAAGQGGNASAAPGAATSAPPLPSPARPPAQLALGMTRDEVVAAMGVPQRETSFQGRAWLTYPNMVIVLEDGKLKSIDQSAAAPAKAAIRSTPDGAEIYLDGQLIGSTPSSLELPAGTHDLSVRLSGYQDWNRSMRVLSGSEINLDAKLEKK
jgi:PEGA domain